MLALNQSLHHDGTPPVCLCGPSHPPPLYIIALTGWHSAAASRPFDQSSHGLSRPVARTCYRRFATGVNWDAESQRFRHGMAVSAFSDPVELTVEREGNMDYWTTLEVTLHPVVNGNAQTEPLDESAFQVIATIESTTE